MCRITGTPLITLINKIFTLEEGPEVEDLPDPKTNECCKSEPGKTLHSLVSGDWFCSLARGRGE